MGTFEEICRNVKVPIMLCDHDRRCLEAMAKEVTQEGLCIEIGSAFGDSTISILKGLSQQRLLICCSLFGPREYECFNVMMRWRNAWHRIVPITADFRDFWNHIQKAPIRFLFIDHDHSEQSNRDVDALLVPQLTSGAILMMHDYKNPAYPSVTEYVNRYQKQGFVLHGATVDTMAVLQKI